MRRFVLSIATPLLLLGCSAAASLASEGPKPDTFASRLLGKPLSADRTRACFTRVYDAAHLAGHPKQKVTAMMLLVSGTLDQESKAPTYAFSVGVRFRGKPARYESAGDCRHADLSEAKPGDPAAADLGCSVDCDGGGFEIVLSPDNAAALLTLERLTVAEHGKDLTEGISFESGADDHAFRLQRAPLADCVPLADDKQDALALRGGK